MPADPQRVQSVFLAAVDQPSAERAVLLDRECGSDLELRRRVETLLEAYDRPGSFLDSPPAELAGTIDQPLTEGPGTVIGPYKLLQEIGAGGMGVVFMAEQSEPVERRVALKIIKPGMDTRQVIARFEAERQALAMMDHPNIARVLDAGTTGRKDEGGRMRDEGKRTGHPDSSFIPHPSSFADPGRPYFVMELVKGVPITQYCDEHHLTPRERLELFVPVCQAVQHAHQKGIIHRDLKPSNVLVCEYDDRPVPKIIDFGVAKATNQKLTEKTMFTQFGQLVGTLEYMSPEQANLNQLDIDTRSDIYSLGVLLYELLTGVTPFDRQRLRSAAFEEMMRIIREEEPPKPSTRLSTLDTLPSVAANRQTEPKKLSTLVRGELDWIVMRALEKDRSRRYETANGFANDIQRYLNDEAVVACPPSAAYRFCKFARRNRAAIVTASLIGVALILGLLGTTWQAIRATTAEKRTRIEQEQTKTQRDRAVRAEAIARGEADNARQAAEGERQIAEQEQMARHTAQRHLYDAHMNLVQLAYEQGRRARVLELLGRYPSPSPSAPRSEDLRSFEWYYWWRECHRYWKTIAADPDVVALSPDGKTMAVGWQLWNVVTEQRLGTLCYDGAKELEDAIAALEKAHCADPDDTKIEGELAAKLWKRERLNRIAFAPDGNTIATMSSESGTQEQTCTIRLWDAATRTQRRVLATAQNEPIRIGPELAFSPDGASLTAILPHVSTDVPQEVRVWDTATGQVKLTIKPSGDSVPGEKGGKSMSHCAAFSPDSTTLATGGCDEQGMGMVCLWDLTTGGKLKSFCPRDAKEILAWLIFAPDGATLLAFSFSGELTTWNVGSGEVVTSTRFPKAGVISPDGRRMAVAGDHGSLELWDVASGTQTAMLLGHNEQITGLAFSSDSRTIVSAAYENMRDSSGQRGSIRIWDVSTDRLCFDYLTIPDIPRSRSYHLFAFSPDSRTVACCNQRGTVDLWNLETHRRARTLNYGYFGRANAVAFAPDGNSLAAAGRDVETGKFRVALYDLRTASTRTVGEHVHQVNSLAFTRDGRHLASADAMGILQAWDVVSGKLTRLDPQDPSESVEQKTWVSSSPYGLGPALGALSVSPDGTRIAFPKPADAGKKAKPAIANLTTGEWERELGVEQGRMLAFSADGRLLAVGGDMAIHLLDCQTWQVRHTWTGRRQFVNGLAFSPNGKRLVTTSRDQIILWNVATQTPVWTRAAPGRQALSSVAFSSDGAWLAVAGDGVMRIYRGASETEVVAGCPRPEVIPEMELAESSRQRRAWDEAVVHYTRVIEQAPDDDAARWGRAGCYVETGELDSALQDYQRVVEIWQKSGVDVDTQGTLMQDLTNLATEWQRRERPEQALQVHRLALQLCQATYDRAIRLRRFPLREGAGPDAQDLPRIEVTRAMLGLAGANRRLGGALAQAGDASAAVPCLRKSLEILDDTEVRSPKDIEQKRQITALARRGLNVLTTTTSGPEKVETKK